MSDDSFIREVEEELRSDRFKALWKRFGPLIIAAAVLLVALTAAWRGWLAYAESRANASGDAFLRAIELAEEGDRDGALEALATLEESGAGRYDLLARMRAASLTASSDPEAAIAAFTAVADSAQTPAAIADVARLRAGYLLVDHGDAGEANALVGRLAVEDDPMRHSAREVLGLAALKAGDRARATSRFREITADPEVPPGIAARANEVLALIRATDGAGIADGADVADGADTATNVGAATGTAVDAPTAVLSSPDANEPTDGIDGDAPNAVATPAAPAVGAPAATTPVTVPAAE